MANVLLGVTGSVAAVKTPALFAALRGAGHAVRIVATEASLYFFDPADPSEPTGHGKRARDPAVVSVDADEWPGRAEGQRYERGDDVLHIELRRWAEVFVIAPLDANTLAKLANGLSDNCLTCVWRAWDPTRPVVLAPAMNTLMWQHPLTRRHLRQLAVDASASHIPGHFNEMQVIAQLNERSPTLRVVPPQVKRLACGDVGAGAMAEVEEIVGVVEGLLGTATV